MSSPGKYDFFSSFVQRQTQAEGVIVCVINGSAGNGMSVTASPEITLRLPAILKRMSELLDAAEKAGIAGTDLSTPENVARIEAAAAALASPSTPTKGAAPVKERPLN